MKLVVGLGNPGRKYERARHNIGFMVAEALATQLHAGLWKGESRAEVARATLDGDPVLVAKPQTFMNESGRSVRALTGFYKLAPADILVVADDLDLPFATLRLRPGGSAGGHNGLKSIIADLGTQDFPRLRIGIGRPARGETIDYVLAPFDESERAELPLIIVPAVDAALSALRAGVLAAMNEHNGRGDLRLPPPPPRPARITPAERTDPAGGTRPPGRRRDQGEEAQPEPASRAIELNANG